MTHLLIIDNSVILIRVFLIFCLAELIWQE